jgi:hypothetical protein
MTMDTESMINRAARALQYATEAEAAALLMADGASNEAAFLAVKAAAILNRGCAS